jgi:hypothetical protein
MEGGFGADSVHYSGNGCTRALDGMRACAGRLGKHRSARQSRHLVGRTKWASPPEAAPIVAIALIHKPITLQLLIAGVLMALGHVHEHHCHAHEGRRRSRILTGTGMSRFGTGMRTTPPASSP